MPISYPHPGISTWKVKPEYGSFRVVRLSFEADPEKGLGEKTFVPEANMDMSPWLLKQFRDMSDKNLFRQEILIDFEATQGELLFPNFRDYQSAIVEKPFPIPLDWTRYYAVDPHPRVPHAHLWCAVDPYGERWYYREFWPSKVYGKPGKIPEDDNRYTIKEHMEVVKWLESADNPDNRGQDENIRRRVIDYAARSFGLGTTDDHKAKKDAQDENFQKRFERTMRELKINRPYFQDAIKDRDAGIERVNAGMKPKDIEIDGKWVPKAPIHIIAESCPELCYELLHNRYHKLTPLQQETEDPSAKAVKQRTHESDLIRYHEMAEHKYIPPQTMGDNWEPLHEGINY